MKQNNVLGITGRICTGKTSAARFFREKGYRIVDADAVYHELLQTSEKLQGELDSCFGTHETAKLSKMLLEPEFDLAALNRITHKYVTAEVQKAVEAAEDEPIALDIPIPVKNGFLDLCGFILVTDCDEAIQVERLMKRNGFSQEEAELRVAIQMGREVYRALGDTVMNTSRMTLNNLWEALEHLPNFRHLFGLYR